MNKHAPWGPATPKSGVQVRQEVARRGGRRWLDAIALALCFACGSALAAVHEVAVMDFVGFFPEQITIAPGDTVRWVNQGPSSHNVVADSGQFSSGAPSSARWTFEHTFTAVGANPYYCDLHGGPGGQGMSGNVTVAAPASEPFVINEGVAGSWFNPETVGQGLFMEASAELGLVTLAWFTWTATAGEYDWLTGAGPFQGNEATLTLNRSSGGRFNDGAAVVTSVPTGSAVLTFHDCSNATLEFEMSVPPRTGRIELQRVLPPTPSCIDANPDGVATGDD